MQKRSKEEKDIERYTDILQWLLEQRWEAFEVSSIKCSGGSRLGARLAGAVGLSWQLQLAATGSVFGKHKPKVTWP